MFYKPSIDYPPGLLPTTTGSRVLLPVKKLTFKGMREAISLTYRMVKIGTWGICEGKCYLRTKGIDTTLAGNFTKFGSNTGKLQTVLKNMEDNKI